MSRKRGRENQSEERLLASTGKLTCRGGDKSWGALQRPSTVLEMAAVSCAVAPGPHSATDPGKAVAAGGTHSSVPCICYGSWRRGNAARTLAEQRNDKTNSDNLRIQFRGKIRTLK